MRHLPELLLVSCLLFGCQAFDSFTIASRHPASSNKSPLIRTFNLNDSKERAAAMAGINQELMGQEIAEAPLGSRVSVVNDFDQRAYGTLLRKTPDSLEVMNCICKEIVSGPDGQKQCKTSHIPVLAVPRSTLTYFAVLLPKSGRRERKSPYEHDIDAINAIVLMSGRCQRWQEPAEKVASESESEADSIDDLPERIAATPRGSQVFFVDQSGQQFNAIFLKASQDEVHLMNCVWKESLPAHNGQSRWKTSHVPFQSIPTSSLNAFEILKPPGADLDLKNLETDCQEYCVDEFVDLSKHGQP